MSCLGICCRILYSGCIQRLCCTSLVGEGCSSDQTVLCEGLHLLGPAVLQDAQHIRSTGWSD